MKKMTPYILCLLLIIAACRNNSTAINQPSNSTPEQAVVTIDFVSSTANFALKLSAAALSLTRVKVVYDPAYFEKRC